MIIKIRNYIFVGYNAYTIIIFVENQKIVNSYVIDT